MSDDLKLRIESDGTARGTHVYAVDSQGRKSRISRVQTIDVHGDAGGNMEAQITVLNPELDLEIVDGKVKFEGRL